MSLNNIDLTAKIFVGLREQNPIVAPSTQSEIIDIKEEKVKILKRKFDDLQNSIPSTIEPTLIQQIEKSRGKYRNRKETEKTDVNQNYIIIDPSIENSTAKYGKILFKTKENYEGAIENDQAHGPGRMTRENKWTYIGNFSRNKFDGTGDIFYANGYRYIGEFREGKKHGFGQLFHNDKLIYEGPFLFDKPHGKGIWNYVDGGMYIGELVDGRYEGKGTFVYPDKKIYVGEFINGKRDGNGWLIDKDNSIFYGSLAKDIWQQCHQITFDVINNRYNFTLINQFHAESTINNDPSKESSLPDKNNSQINAQENSIDNPNPPVSTSLETESFIVNKLFAESIFLFNNEENDL